MIKSRTKKQALLHIRRRFIAGKLGSMIGRSCVYKDPRGNHCAVGCLFTPMQLTWLKAEELLEVSVRNLALSYVGIENIYHMTGMDVDELEQVQEMHDNWARCTDAIRKDKRAAEFSEFLNKMIEGC